MTTIDKLFWLTFGTGAALGALSLRGRIVPMTPARAAHAPKPVPSPAPPHQPANPKPTKPTSTLR